MARFSAKEWFAALVLCTATTIIVLALIQEKEKQRPKELTITTSGKVEMCLSCHSNISVDTAHDPKVIGCSSCHLGNPLAVGKEEAHLGMVINGGDLRIVEKSCSTAGCHQADAHRVKNSLMATNRGIIGTLRYYWGESNSQDTDITIEELIKTNRNSFSLDYFRKLCATCHLWKQRFDMPGAPLFFNEKGGGCSACHLYFPGDEKKEEKKLLLADDDIIWYPKNSHYRDESGEKKEVKHPQITKKVRSYNCLRCHNRSGRIGISYIGVLESEGYGTPFVDGDMTSKRLPGGRFYLELADDVHHKAGMECIDCHLREEIMGDGTSYAHYEDQLEIRCTTCHGENNNHKKIGISSKERPLTNLKKNTGNKLQLSSKVSNKKWQIKSPKKGICDFPAHKRVSCEACHSTWVPQCYGCHIRRNNQQKHLDKLSLRETLGRWKEGRSYIRYEKPMLGVWNDEVVIMTPGCQDMVTVVDDKGELSASFNRFTMAAINPHTTQAKGRECVDCHTSPKTVGLGEGRIAKENGALVFIPLQKGLKTSAGKTVPLDAYVSLAGKALQHSSRMGLRPFNAEELRRILRVGECVRCHTSYADPLWKRKNKKKKLP